MKIHEVEALAGITRGNIRFYEKEGLLSPNRNSENGYRTYDEADVIWLKKIRLLRMLDVPIEEIRRMKDGQLTLADAMERHLVQLQRRRYTLDSMTALCTHLRDSREQLGDLDPDAVLASMEAEQQQGTQFVPVNRTDKIRRYAGPVLGAGIMIGLMLLAFGAMVATIVMNPEGSPPILFMAIVLVIPILVIAGTIAALLQRFKELDKGEEEAAKIY